MENKKRYSATELARLHLSGLPTTRENILRKAEREGWPYIEERSSGRLGYKRVFEVPDLYLKKSAANTSSQRSVEQNQGSYIAEHIKPAKKSGVVGTVAAGSANVDIDLLSLAAQVLEDWAAEKGLVVKPERKGAIIALLYRIIADGGDAKDLEQLLRQANSA